MTEQKLTELLRHAYHCGRDNGLNRSEKNFNDFLQTEAVRQAFLSFKKMPLTEIANDFEFELFKLINFYAKNGLKKPDLVAKMEYATDSCKMS